LRQNDGLYRQIIAKVSKLMKELSQRKCVLMIAAQSRDAPLTRGAEPRRLEVG
jgi:hypothetical protein